MIDADLACTNEVQAIEQEIVSVRSQASHINVEKGALFRQLEQVCIVAGCLLGCGEILIFSTMSVFLVGTSQGTGKIQQLQARVDELNSAILASVQRENEHRQNLSRGDEIIAQRLQVMEQRLRDKKALRNHAREVRTRARAASGTLGDWPTPTTSTRFRLRSYRRSCHLDLSMSQEMENIAERHRQLQAKQIEEMRANIRQQEAELIRQLQENGFAQDVLEGSPTGVRRVAADTFRHTAMLPQQPMAYNSSGQSPLRSAGFATGGAAAPPHGAYGLASPPPGRGPPNSMMMYTGPATTSGSAHLAPYQLQAQPGSIAEMVRTGHQDATLKAAAQNAAARLLAQGQRRR